MKQNIPNTPQRRFWCIPHVAEYIQGEEGRRQTPEKEKRSRRPGLPNLADRWLILLYSQTPPKQKKSQNRAASSRDGMTRE